MATETSQKPIHSIIIDTGPLIKNAVSISTIINAAEVLYTTPAIIAEIRDPATRSRVETTLLPFLNIKTPSPTSYEAVAAFAKKTGDYPVLSRQDLGILALAYEVHCEKNGGPWGLRNVPKGPRAEKPGNQPEAKSESEQKVEGVIEAPQGEVAVNPRSRQDGEHAPTEESIQPDVQSSEEPPSANTADLKSQSTEEPVKEATQQQQQTAKELPSEPAIESKVPIKGTEAVQQDLSNLQVSDLPSATQQPTPPASSEEDDSDGGEWITPGNVSKHKAKDADKTPLRKGDPQMGVATMTIDFAMQNVLLQMGMDLLSTNMQRIRRARAQVLRCHACFLVTREMDKQFCSRCGQPALKRVSCSTNSKGEFRIHLAKNYQHTNRGNRYSIPKPVAGTSNGKNAGKGGGKGGWGRELVLSEDQKEYQKQIGEGKRTKTRDLMDEDYLPGLLICYEIMKGHQVRSY
ncbi:20S-pre-rRNA D-site endonuclease nob1 [Kalmusia sp. IMI 367209]|nr:20S-pre-rRNA D-site endonuclease nob1 [Kalmusia sp. IMI 367209]